jgi:hypothetical protein
MQEFETKVPPHHTLTFLIETLFKFKSKVHGVETAHAYRVLECTPQP